MMDAGPSGGDGRRRGKRNRGRPVRKNRPRKQPSSRNQQGQQIDRLPPVASIADGSILGGRPAATGEPKQRVEEGAPDAFALYCACHLGVTSDDGYHRPHLDEVARRYGMKVDQLQALMLELEVDQKTINKVGFDLQGAQLDVRVAPQGISKTEVARDSFQEFLEIKAEVKS